MKMKGWLLLIAVVAVGVLLAGSSRAFGSLVEQQLYVPLSPRVLEVMTQTPSSFPHTWTRMGRYYTTWDLDSAGSRWRGELTYNDIQLDSSDITYWTGGLAYQRPYDTWGWGFVVPEQYWGDFDDDDSEWMIYEGIMPYGYYQVNRRFRIGVLGEVDYLFSDGIEFDEEFSYGFGGFGSYRIDLGSKVTIMPKAIVTYYNPGQDGRDNSIIFSLGGRLRYSLLANLNLDLYAFYTTDTENDDLLDDTYVDLGALLNFRVSDKIEFSGGYETTQEFDDYERNAFKVGLTYNF